jgi:hypothetical protein
MSTASTDALAELTRARAAFPGRFNTPHEGWAVLREEVDELWDEVKGKHPDRQARMRTEAVQVAAMALRFIEDCCDSAPGASRALGIASSGDGTFFIRRFLGGGASLVLYASNGGSVVIPCPVELIGDNAIESGIDCGEGACAAGGCDVHANPSVESVIAPGLDVYECVACSSRPGATTLCADCLRRREAAGSAWKGPRPRKTPEDRVVMQFIESGAAFTEARLGHIVDQHRSLVAKARDEARASAIEECASHLEGHAMHYSDGTPERRAFFEKAMQLRARVKQ